MFSEIFLDGYIMYDLKFIWSQFQSLLIFIFSNNIHYHFFVECCNWQTKPENCVYHKVENDPLRNLVTFVVKPRNLKLGIGTFLPPLLMAAILMVMFQGESSYLSWFFFSKFLMGETQLFSCVGVLSMKYSFIR